MKNYDSRSLGISNRDQDVPMAMAMALAWLVHDIM